MLESILLIDDDATTNHVNKRLLLRSGKVGNVEVAESGAAALHYLQNIAGMVRNKRPDVILLDLKMGGMDGFGFLEEYSKLPENQKAKIMVALTSSASFYDLDRLKGFPDIADHLYKPLTVSHLDNLIKHLEENTVKDSNQ